jgi:hypothetical protein
VCAYLKEPMGSCRKCLNVTAKFCALLWLERFPSQWCGHAQSCRGLLFNLLTACSKALAMVMLVMYGAGNGCSPCFVRA